MSADGHGRCDAIGGQHGAQREAAADALGGGQDVRHHTEVLVGVQVAGTPGTALDFIEDQQRIVLVTQLTQSFEECLLAGDDAALALQRLDDDRAGVIAHQLAHGVEIVEFGVLDTARNRPEALGILGLATDADGEEGAAMEGLTEGDDLVLLLAMGVVGETTRQLERGLVGLTTGGAEVDLVGEGALGQRLGQRQCRLVGVDIGQVPDLVGLVLERLDQRRVAVTQRGDGDATGEVDVLATFLIPQTATLAAYRNGSLGCVVGHHGMVEIGTGQLGHRLFLIAGSWRGRPMIGKPRVMTLEYREAR